MSSPQEKQLVPPGATKHPPTAARHTPAPGDPAAAGGFVTHAEEKRACATGKHRTSSQPQAPMQC